jgi:hypothetical protein
VPDTDENPVPETDSKWNQSRHDQWWLRLRRAYDIPDLISNAHAKHALLTLLNSSMQLQHVQNQRAVLEEVLDFILAAAGSGKLDDRIVPDELTEGMTRACESISTETLVAGGTAHLHETLVALREFADMLIGKVTASVQALPFEDANGRWYALS